MTKLLNEKVGEIKAQIIERDGQIWMVKDCPEHGFEDMMAIDVKFLEWIEKNFPGRDIHAHNDEGLHNHGTSTIKYGRGSVLTVDLTNRCNMMCDPCFMDANQVGFVHELSWEEIKEIMDNAIAIKPRRQMSVQFSGGEPTMSPYFFEAVGTRARWATTASRRPQTASSSPRARNSAKKAAEAGLRYAYLQFDGIGNDANSHRQIGNLFDVKLRAINNLHEAGVEIVLVDAGQRSQQRPGGSDHPICHGQSQEDRLHFVSAGFVYGSRRRDHCRAPPAPALHAVAHGPRREKTGRHHRADTRLVPDFVDGRVCGFRRSGSWTGSRMGTGQLRLPPELRCRHGRHDQQGNQGNGSGAAVPQHPGTGEGHAEDHGRGRGKWFSNVMMGLALLKNYNPFEGPPSLTLMDIFKKFDKSFGLTGKNYGKVSGDRTVEDIEKRRQDPWNFLFIAGMWFQDLFNYDFRRTEMCIIPYGTQEGEISFCAYNTGIGWRKIIENMHQNATVQEWYKKHGKHGVYAGGHDVPLTDFQHNLILNSKDMARVREHADVPETAAEEEGMKRAAQREAEKMKRMMDELTFGKNLGSTEAGQLVKIELAKRKAEEVVNN